MTRFLEFDNCKYALQEQWIRVTENPKDVPLYPKTGDIVELRGHNLVADDRYLVAMVKQYEPAFHSDPHGKDIRITLVRVTGNTITGSRYTDLNGWNIIMTMLRDVSEE